MEYEAIRYNSKEWAIFAKKSNCFVLFGSKKNMIDTAKRLNKLEEV